MDGERRPARPVRVGAAPPRRKYRVAPVAIADAPTVTPPLPRSSREGATADGRRPSPDMVRGRPVPTDTFGAVTEIGTTFGRRSLVRGTDADGARPDTVKPPS